jgi:hypothetical protein
MPSVPNIYASRMQGGEETMWPAGTAMMPPAGAAESLRPVPKTEVRLSSPAPKPAAASAPAPTPAPAAKAAPAALDDEVFSPSMFLGGGL